MPQPPAMIGHFSFERITICCFTVTAEFINGWNKLVGVVFKIINLCGFKPHIIYACFFCQLFYIFHLVFIGFYNQELKNYKWRFTFQFFFPPDDIFRSFQHFIEIAANAVLLIYILCSSVNGNDEAIQSAFYRTFCIFVIDVMSIGGCCSINIFFDAYFTMSRKPGFR